MEDNNNINNNSNNTTTTGSTGTTGTTVIDATMISSTSSSSNVTTEEQLLIDNGGFRVWFSNPEDPNHTLITKEYLECRMYENIYPDIESVVMVNVRTIADMGAYVTLLEYNHIEGMILLSELSRRRIRSIHKLIRVNRNEVVMVLRVDMEKGYIDLSKRRVSTEDIIACEERYNKAKTVHGILRHIAEKHHYYLIDVYERIGWPLYKKYGHAYDAFKLAISQQQVSNNSTSTTEDGSNTTNTTTIIDDPFQLLLEEPYNIPISLIHEMKVYILRKLAPQPVKIRADIEVSCFTYYGIDAIITALTAGTQVAVVSNNNHNNNENTNSNNVDTENNTTATTITTTTPSVSVSPIKIKLIAPPIYVLSITTLDKDYGIMILQKAIDTIYSIITAAPYYGKCNVKMAPKSVSDKEEKDLQAMMDRLAMENEQVDGDTPEIDD